MLHSFDNCWLKPLHAIWLYYVVVHWKKIMLCHHSWTWYKITVINCLSNSREERDQTAKHDGLSVILSVNFSSSHAQPSHALLRDKKLQNIRKCFLFIVSLLSTFFLFIDIQSQDEQKDSQWKRKRIVGYYLTLNLNECLWESWSISSVSIIL